MTIDEGENISLTCDAEGPPKPTFTWTIVGDNVTIGKIIPNKNMLELNNVRSDGRFHFTVICRASNKGGNSAANATIEILVKPRIINLNPNKTQLLYDNVTLTCQVLANPLAQIWWTKDGNQSHLNNVRFENDNRSFVITKAVLDNIGTYSCHASSNLSSTSKQLTLHLKALPKTFIVGEEIRKLRKGQKNSSITCLGYGYPDPKVTWKINNTAIPENSDSSIGSGIYQRRSTNDMVLQNFTSTLYFNQSGSSFEDFGNYTCEVSIKQAPETDSKVVKVIFYPIVTTGPRNVTVLQDDNVRFDCEVDGRPHPSTSWLFQNKSVSTNHTLLSNGSLLLYSVQNAKAYEGEYSCFAENEAGRSEKSSATLTVHVPARILSISKTEVHQLKDNVTLTCDAEGDPSLKIFWMKEKAFTSFKFILSSDRQSLTITNVTLDDQGTYICIAINRYGHDIRNTTVNVEVRPETKVNSSSAIYLDSVNEEAIIRCSGRGYPAPVVSWYKDGKMVNTNSSKNADVYQVTGRTKPHRFLEWISTILYVKPDDTHTQFGNYTCNARKLKENEPDLKTVEIVLVPTVAITRSPNTSTVLEGTNVTFTCTANGAPKPTIIWRRVNGSISTTKSSMNTSYGRNVLLLTNVTNEDEGDYECTAHNRGDPVKKRVNLNVHVKPRILQHIKEDDVQNGTSYKLNCSAYGDPALTYSWTKNGDKDVPNAVLSIESKTLHINPITIDNEGTYKCVVRNIEGNASTTADILVFARPEILYPPENATRNETDIAKFSCGGSGIPTPRIIWKKNGEKIKNSTKYDIETAEEQFNIRTSSLKIKNLEYTDRGNYSCTLMNRKDKDFKATVLVVQVQPKAKIDPNMETIKITKPVNFTCKVYGFPEPQVSWMKNGEQIENSSYHNVSNFGNGSNLTWYSNLAIENVRRDDTANYSCFLRNAAGTDVSNVLLVVLERPDRLNIFVTNFTSRSVIIKWKANFNGNRDILNYTLKYFINGSNISTTITLFPNLTSYRATSLKPFNSYIFEITATNEIGISDVSSTFTNTLEDRPTRPRSVSVVPLDSTSLNVAWLPPEEENGKIVKYVVYYQRVGSDESHSIVANANERSKVIADLKPYTNYSIEVVANTSVGYGNKSDPVINRTDEAVPSSPQNLTVQVESNTTIQVSWLRPQYENGIIDQYSIHVKEQGVKSSERIVNVSKTMISTVVDSLKPYTYYTFRVRARTSAGWGNFSASVSNQTDEGLPSKPLNFTANVNSNTTVQLSWTEPNYPNGIIRGYHVYYKETEGEGEIGHNATVETRVGVDDLTPYTNYSFWIYARTSAGLGNKSETNFIETHEGVPTEPRNVTAVALNSSSVNVNWFEPKTPYGIITKYVIYYRKTSEENGWNETTVQNEYSKVLTSLSEYTEYSIAVQAFTRAGGGKWSEIKKRKTDPGIPLRPTNPPITFKPTGRDFDSTRMIAVTLPKFSVTDGEIRSYKVIVVMVDNTITEKKLADIFETEESNLLSYEQWKELPDKIDQPYIAFAFAGQFYEQNKNFIVGDNQTSTDIFARRKKRSEQKYTNGELIPNKQYAIAVRGYTAKDKYVTSQPLKARTNAVSVDEREPPIDTTVVVVIVVVAVVLSFLFLTAVWFRIKKNRSHQPDTGTAFHNLGHAVPLPEFRFYVQSKQFGEEFQDIPKILDREITAAKTEKNMPKNRYKNIVPYDYTRVHLHRDEGDDDTDYINASFIKGLKIPSKYIATQGPLLNTTNDFWQMVWENEVSVVVMLTGLVEKGTVKCYQYWPANSDEQVYGNLTLKITGETVLADFTTRYFELKETATGQIRVVQHLHFTAWPDHGVPKYAGPLLHFHQRYRSGLSGREPVVVHCSAGCGRTGTFIALDYILHKLDEEKYDDPSIDVLHFVREMRGQRILMVQTEEQYRFIHQAVLEAVTFADTEISSTNIRVSAAKLRETVPGTSKTRGKEVFENLQKRILPESCEDGSSSDNQKKNRSQVLPFDYNRVPLKEMQNCTDYINASVICGYQYPKNFIATQHPLPNTVNDFWRMIHEQKSAVVVAITTQKEINEFGSYWPEEGYTASYGPINVAFEETNKDFAASGFVVRKFKLTDTRDSIRRPLAVTHFHFVDWSRHELPTASSMLRLLAEVEKAQRSSGNTLVTVHCSDGSGRTGTFCAIVSCIERVKVENNINLPMTVRNLQAQRMEMVQNEAQYIFCYDVVAAFLTSFDDQMYDNFQKEKDDDEEYPETSMDDQNRLVSKF